MKTDKEIKRLINKAFQDDSDAEKAKLAKLLSSETRLKVIKDNVLIQEDMLNIMEPLAISEAQKINKSRSSRGFKKRILTEALMMICTLKPNMKRTLGNIWLKLNLLKDKDIQDPLTGEKAKIYTSGTTLFIVTDGQKKPLKYTKRSLQPFIDALK